MMLGPQRHAAILDYVRRLGGVSVGELSEFLGVSPATVRRDLQVLAVRGQLERVHGGALRLSLADFERPASTLR